MATATTKRSSTRQKEIGITDEAYDLYETWKRFRKTGIPKGRQINDLIKKRKLSYPVRSDEFVIYTVPGEKFGPRWEFEGLIFDIKNKKDRELVDHALVLSYSKLDMVIKDDRIHIEGKIQERRKIPTKDGWYKVDEQDTALPIADAPSTASDPDARYWVRNEAGGIGADGLEVDGHGGGAVVRLPDLPDYYLRRSIQADLRPGDDLRVAQHGLLRRVVEYDMGEE